MLLASEQRAVNRARKAPRGFWVGDRNNFASSVCKCANDHRCGAQDIDDDDRPVDPRSWDFESVEVGNGRV